VAICLLVAPPVPAQRRFVAYPLDSISRDVPANAKRRVRCPKVRLVRYRGTVVRYRPAARVYVGFRRRLQRFERELRDVAKAHYGRAPSRILQAGTYSCRPIRWMSMLSEHALGNAIDILGFAFPRGRLKPGLPVRLKGPFTVTVKRHGRATRGVGAIHARFLRKLARRLEQKGVFRVMLGPASGGHADHFHFDMAPYQMIQTFN
jgi:hypothetical protein